ncbi:MAG: hypothetical protein IJH50_04940 [Kiritimatiellae bacterium]|nr:hypothetical protein [Kiritimatiellia bacterium]
MDQEQIVDALRDWLDKDDWHYEYDAENHVIRAGVILDCKLRNARVFIHIREDDSYTVNIISPISGDPKNMGELVKYVAMANFGLVNGNFDVNVRTGELRYKTYVNCKDLEKLPDQIIKDSICAGWYVMEYYGDGIAALAMGFSDAEAEIKKAEGPDED